MNTSKLLSLVLLFITGAFATVEARQVNVSLQLAQLEKRGANPYVAIWVTKQQAIGEPQVHEPLVLLKEKTKWLRDLKQFWRKIARENRQQVDAITSATTARKSLRFSFELDSSWQSLSVEVVREHGKRELVTLTLASPSCVAGKKELVNVCFSID